MYKVLSRFFLIALFASVFSFSGNAVPTHTPIPVNVLSFVQPEILTAVNMAQTGANELTAQWASINCPEPPVGGFKYNYIALINANTMAMVQGLFSQDGTVRTFSNVPPGTYFVSVADCHSTRRSANVTILP